MKKIFLTVAAVFSLILTSCTNNPQNVAEDYVKALQENNPEAVIKLISGYDDADESMRASVLATMKVRMNMMDSEKKNFIKNLEFSKMEEDGDRATAVFKDKSSDEEFNVDLKKEDGKWVVNM